MPDQKYVLEDVNGKRVTVHVRKDKRLKKSSRWILQIDGTILIRVPYGLSQRNIGYLLDQVAGQLKGLDKLADRRTDVELQLRAEQINKQYFEGRIRWRAIRWVSNMNTRFGSCTSGGRTDGHIRISDKIKNWPQWVVDYIIAHELVHRLYPDHSDAFWETLNQGYPLAERARGFIKGINFAEGHGFEE